MTRTTRVRRSGQAMAIARTATELQRWSDLAIIRRAIATRMPVLHDSAGLGGYCRALPATYARPPWSGLARRAVRLILMIGCEWDLANDRLDAQSAACLDCLARFLS